MILLGKTTLNGKSFTMADSQGTVYPKQLGLSDNWYGGYVKELRKTKYGIFLCLTRKGEIVNLGYTEDSLTDEGRKLLGMVSTANSEPDESDISQLDRKELIALAKKLEIEGKLATMKTVDLIAVIQEKQG
jgi:hypothetical protein